MDVLKETEAKHPSIGKVRDKGSMINVELLLNRETKEPAKEFNDRVVKLGLKHTLLMLSRDKWIILFTLPLSITKSEIDKELHIIEEILGLTEKEPHDNRFSL